MFKADFDKLESKFRGHKKVIDDRSRNWGKKKFSPNTFANREPPPVQETAQPWKHVKNDIVDDEQEQRSSDRFYMKSQQAKDILKQREQNHRRNVIEAGRSQKTTWETFEDDAATSTSKTKNGKGGHKTQPMKGMHIDPDNMTFKERNFIRRKLTRVVMTKKMGTLDSAIRDIKRNHARPQSNWIPKDPEQPVNKKNKFRNTQNN
ncbi:uncharacterized protein LOC115758390 [Drosophila novamexicana]|uniref:uncharacterized protein LOC115758390 n=1 Tax=Drosophila novamexicana TaxID=47314 RepID=UPI0011E59F2A|nr:uncharacterized protein LOC115758390 [Drosophila novamexicana]